MTKAVSLVLMMMFAATVGHGQARLTVSCAVMHEPGAECIEWANSLDLGSIFKTDVIQHAERYVKRAGYDAEGFWRVDYEDGNYIRICGLSWAIGNGHEICLSQWQMIANRDLPSSTRLLFSRPPLQRDSGRALSADRLDPISVGNGSGGYPEIAPGSYVVVQAPINRTGKGWGQVTEVDGVSVTVGGTPALIFEVWKDGASFIASNQISVGRTHDVVITTPAGRYHGKVKVLDVAPGISRGFRAGSFQSWPVGLFRVGSGFPAPISDQPIPPSRGSSKTVARVLAAGFRRAQGVEVCVEGQPVPLISVTPFFLPGQEEIAFELPAWLWGEDRLVKVTIFADGLPANPFWLRLPSGSGN